MSQRQEKKQRRFIRKLAGAAYTDRFARQGERDAKLLIMQKAVKPKPIWLPTFLWLKIINRVMRSPDEIAFGTPTQTVEKPK